MPLKVVPRPGTRLLWIRGSVKGQAVFESTGVADPGQAEEVRAKREAELFQRAVYGAASVITFAEALESYLKAEARSDQTKRHCAKLLAHFGMMKLREIDQSAVDAAYGAILTERGGAAARSRTVLGPLRAILNHGAKRKWCDVPALEEPRIITKPRHYFTPEKANALIQEMPAHYRPLLIFQFGTGCRMGEAFALDWSAVDLFARRVKVWQKQGTAGHANAERYVDLPPVVVAALAAMGKREGRVFTEVAASATYQTGSIRTTWDNACKRVGLPGRTRLWQNPGRGKPTPIFTCDFTPHMMRHTWASWHYAVHKDLLRLRNEGGWANTQQVETYAHVMPDAYRDQITDWWNGGPALLREVG